MRDKLNNVNKMFFHNTNKIITFYIIMKIKLHPIPIGWKGVKSNKVKSKLLFPTWVLREFLIQKNLAGRYRIEIVLSLILPYAIS